MKFEIKDVVAVYDRERRFVGEVIEKTSLGAKREMVLVKYGNLDEWFHVKQCRLINHGNYIWVKRDKKGGVTTHAYCPDKTDEGWKKYRKADL